MNSEQIRSVVLNQISAQWARSNLHGCDLRKCLVDPPEKIDLVDVKDETDRTVWLVLLENPDTRLGYGIVFDEEAQQFGLTQFAAGYAPCLLGLYGEFFDAFEAM